MAIMLAIFIDDQRVVGTTHEMCKLSHKFTKVCLAMAGWIIKPGKGIDNPTQFGTFLGLDHCLISLRYFIPEVKLANILEQLTSLSKQRRVKIKFLASIYGKVAACKLALGQVATLLTRHGHGLIATSSEANSWEGYTNVSAEVLEEVLKLIDLLPGINGWPMHQRSGFVHAVRSYASDASAYGFGAAEVICGNTLEHLPHPGPCTTGPVVSRPFSLQECEESSTLRELTAVKELVISQAYEWSGEKISVWCDNMAVSVILKKGSKKVHLHRIALDLHAICHQMEIQLSSLWMSRNDPRISQADSMSRFFDEADWGVDEESFQALERCIPKVQIDIFASDSNRKCDKFFSLTPSPLTSGINAFSQRWEEHGYAYVCPPIALIPATIKQILLCKSQGTLAIPMWTASPFWTKICPDGIHFSSLFTRALIGKPKMKSGVHVTSEMFVGWARFNFIYLEFDGRVCLPLFPRVTPELCSLKGCDRCLR
jgi:hypothetical protein